MAGKDASLLGDLYALVEPASDGGPTSRLRWTCESTHRRAVEIKAKDHEVSQQTICELPGQIHFSLKSTRKTREGCRHGDSDAQLPRSAKTTTLYQAARDPVISGKTRAGSNSCWAFLALIARQSASYLSVVEVTRRDLPCPNVAEIAIALSVTSFVVWAIRSSLNRTSGPYTTTDPITWFSRSK